MIIMMLVIKIPKSRQFKKANQATYRTPQRKVLLWALLKKAWGGDFCEEGETSTKFRNMGFDKTYEWSFTRAIIRLNKNPEIHRKNPVRINRLHHHRKVEKRRGLSEHDRKEQWSILYLETLKNYLNFWLIYMTLKMSKIQKTLRSCKEDFGIKTGLPGRRKRVWRSIERRFICAQSLERTTENMGQIFGAKSRITKSGALCLERNLEFKNGRKSWHITWRSNSLMSWSKF